MPNMSAWLVLPTYNEAQNVPIVLNKVFEVSKQLQDFDFNVVVVDSASPDGTADIVTAFAKEHKLTKKLHLVIEKRRGLGQAYDTGFAYANKQGADILIEMDADLSHDPAALPELLAQIKNGADLVIGSRYVQGGFIPGEWPVMRVVNSRVARWVARRIGGVTHTVGDPTAGFKAIRSQALTHVGFVAAGATGYVIQVKMVDAFAKAGLVIKEVPISFADRQFGESKIRMKDIRQFVWFCVKLRTGRIEQPAGAPALVSETSADDQLVADILDEEMSYDRVG
jgi:dolichol-phosphate mannosyltransferase